MVSAYFALLFELLVFGLVLFVLVEVSFLALAPLVPFCLCFVLNHLLREFLVSFQRLVKFLGAFFESRFEAFHSESKSALQLFQVRR